MQTPASLKSAERKAFQTNFADGLWDVLIGCFVLEFALAPLLSEHLGDFWSSFIFLPFWGLVYLAIWLTRKHVVAPRLGIVIYGEPRWRKLRKFSIVMVSINLLIFLLGIITFWALGDLPGIIRMGIVGVLILLGFSAAAFLLDYPRLYVYGLLLSLAPATGEWLYANHGAAHHGFPLVFGFVSALMIVTGLGTFALLLKNNPPVEIPPEAI